ncbi:MAG: hypothetical protein K2J01_05600 [Clostridiales bacterium]|nr:hypothetical protein [Clostridiales bacterium]
MKKFLTSAIAAALVATTAGAFVACGDKDGGNNNNDAQLAQTGLATVIQLTSRIAEETPASYTVMGKTSAGGKMYDVQWSVSSEFPSYETYVSVGDKDENGQVTINITKATEVVEYTLKATVTVGSASQSEEFKHKIPAAVANQDQTEVTIDFTNGETSGVRKEFDADHQLWEQNGIKLTNSKGNSSTNVNNASSNYHVRIYKSSSVKIEYPNMAKLVFHSEASYTDNSGKTSDYPAWLKSSLEAANLGTVTADTENNTVTLTLVGTMDAIEFAASAGQIRLTTLDIVANKTAATDEEKVASIKDSFDLTNKNYFAVNTYNLPAEKLGATITWAVTSDYATIEDGNKLKVTSMPTSETEVTLTATFTLNGKTATKPITIKLVPLNLVNDGTAAHPYTAAEAIMVTSLLAPGTTDTKEVYVKGYVVDPGTYSTFNSYDIYIVDEYDENKTKDSEGAFYIFSVKVAGNENYLSATAGLEKGKLVTFKGKLQNYQKDGTLTPELTNVTIVDVAAAEGASDEDIINAAQKLVTLAKTTFYDKDEQVTLETTKGGATVEWSVKNGPSEYVTVANGKLTVTKLPTDADATVTIVATIKSGTATPATKEFPITVKKYVDISNITEVTLDFAGIEKGSEIKDNAVALTTFKGCLEGDNAATLAAVAASKVYQGNGDGGGDYANKGGFIKMGTSSAKGQLVLTFKKNVTKVTINCIGWTATDTVAVNGATPQTLNKYDGAKKDCVFELDAASKVITIDTANRALIFSIAVEFDTVNDDDPDDAKIAAAKTAADKVIKASYAATKTAIQLPSSGSGGATLKWEVVDGKGVVTIDNENKMTVTNPTTAADVEGVTIKVTITCGTGTPLTETYTTKVLYTAPFDYGTAQSPISVSAALAIAEDECKGVANAATKQVVYMTGKLINAPTVKTSDGETYYQSLTLADLNDANKTIIVYTVNLRADVAAPVENDVLVVCGYIVNYVYVKPGQTPTTNNGTIEFTSNNNTNVYLESNTRGTSNITISNNDDNATVTGIPETATNGTEVTFTVAAKTGKTVTAVKVNGTAINPTEANGNTYTLTVAGNTTVVVESKNDGDEDPVELKTITFNSTNNSKGVSAYESTFDATQDGLAWEVKNFNNNNNGWNYIKGGHTSKALVSSITTKTAVQSKVTKVVVTIDAVTANNINSFKLLISNNADLSDATEVTATIAKGDITFIVPNDAQGTNKYYSIAIDCKVGKASVQLSKVVLWGFEDTTPAPAATTSAFELPEAIVDEQ